MGTKNSVASPFHTVSDEIAAMTTLASRGLSVHPERCVRLRNRHASCRRCADNCTSGAIRIEDGEWVLRPELCVGCGTCATMCPTCALEAQYPNDAQIMLQARRAVHGGDLVLCCHTAIEEARAAGALVRTDAVVEAKCLSRFEETELFCLFADGVKQVTAVHGDCGTCPRAAGARSAHMVQETVKGIMAVWGIEADYRLTDAFPTTVIGTVPGDDVKVVLEGAVDDDAASLVSASSERLAHGEILSHDDEGDIRMGYRPTHVGKDGTLPHFVPSRRQKLLDALGSFGDPAGDVLDTRLWGHVVIDFDLCKSCKMCAVFCPTGAISKYHDENGVVQGIEHYVAECVHCCLCQDICPAGAIRSVTQVPAMQLASGETERYHMPDPVWHSGPDQILQRMRGMIGGNSIEHSY
ncbi:MAG: 4Fe-4S binding protein [Coriobacteriales bacterium]|nr:4Fe-4S binding protein [Coriobacteriales bacterium]